MSLTVRYAITCIKKNDTLRSLFRANQGRNHPETRAEAEAIMKAVTGNNSEANLRQMGIKIETFRIDPVFCYDHGDALGIYVDEIPTMDDATMKHLVEWINSRIPEDRRDQNGLVSQAGMVHRMCAYVIDNELPFKDWDWSAIGDKVQALAREGKWPGLS